MLAGQRRMSQQHLLRVSRRDDVTCRSSPQLLDTIDAVQWSRGKGPCATFESGTEKHRFTMTLCHQVAPHALRRRFATAYRC